MQNSVWKLTALAGVVGIGFLIMLQVQRGMQNQNAQSQSESGDGEFGADESGNEAGDSNGTGPFGVGQFEPAAAGDTQFEQTDLPQNEFADFPSETAKPRFQQPPGSEQGSPAQGSENPFSGSDFSNNNEFEASRDAAVASFGSNDSPPRQPQLEEAAYPDNRGFDVRDGASATINPKSATAARPATNEDSADAQPFNPFASEESESGSAGGAKTAVRSQPDSFSNDAFDSAGSATPEGNATQSNFSESTRKMLAQALVRDARRDLDAGQFDIARQKAIEASKLRVRYGDLDDRPALLLMDIDRLARNQSGGNILQTGATSESARVDAKPSAGKLDGPNLFPTDEDDPFARNDKKDDAGTARVPSFGFDNQQPATQSTGDSATQRGPDRGVDLTPAESEPIGKPAGRPLFRLDPPAEERAKLLFSDQRPSDNSKSAPAFSNRKGDNVAQTAAGGQETPTATGEPQRLLPAPNAVQLDPTGDDLAGTGTIGSNAPKGQQRPQLKIEKLAPPNAILGQPMIYSIIVKNHGQSSAHQVVIEDQIPKGSNLSGTIPRAELTGKKLLWRLGTLEPGEEKKILVKVVPTAKGEIGSIATVNFVAEVASTTIVTAPNLDLKLAAPSKAKLGERVVFQFKLTNTGNGDATGVFLRDIIPNALKHADGNDLEYEVGTIRAGETRDIKLTVTAVKPGQTVNRATITAEGGLEAEAAATIDIVGSQLALTRTGPRRRILGRPAVYSNQVTNDSDFPVTGITIVETIPAGFAFSAAPAGGQYNAGKRTIAWRIGQLGPKQSKTVQATLIPKTQGIHKSIVTAFDGAGSQTQITSQTAVVGLASLESDFTIVEGAVAVGEQVNVRLSLRNRGSSPDRDVSLKLIIPPELQFVSARGPVRYSATRNEIQFQPIAEISGGRSLDFEIVVKALKPGDARLKAQLQSDQLTRPLNTEEAIVIFSDSE